MRVLVVEDDAELRGAIVRRLRGKGFAVDEAPDLDDARLQTGVYDYDCIVLDRRLPSGDGAELVRELRSMSDATPVLFLTARDSLGDRVDGFRSGCDDYLVKPFAAEELLARVASLCRRSGSMAAPIVRIGDLEIDRGRHQVRRGGVLMPLTAKEFCIIELLASRGGSVVTKSDIIDHCWDEHLDPLSNVAEVHVASLRRKLGDPSVISTVRGVGYLLEAPSATEGSADA